MSNNLPEMPPKKPQTEEHKLNALAKEFQTSMVISPNPYNPLSNSMPNAMPYQNYYPPRYPSYNNYGYTGYNSYPGIPYNYGAGQSNQGMEEYYQMEKNSFIPKKSKKGPSNEGDFTSYSAVENPALNSLPMQYDESLFMNARFFIIKSYNEENVIQAVKYNIWSSTPAHNEGLNKVYLSSTPVILFFSVNGSGHFYGVAQMSSEVMFDKYFEGWSQKDKWRGVFEINWVFIKDIPNKEFKEIRNPLNLNKPVHNSRDCQEVLAEEGQKVMKIFEKYQSGSSILEKIKG